MNDDVADGNIGGSTSSKASVGQVPPPRWAWRAAIDLNEDDDGACLAGASASGPARPVTSWWKPKPVERIAEAALLSTASVAKQVDGGLEAHALQPGQETEEDTLVDAASTERSPDGDESDAEAEPEAQVETSGLPLQHDSPHGFRSEAASSKWEQQLQQQGVAPWAEPWAAAPSSAFGGLGGSEALAMRLGLEHDQVPLRAGPKSLLQRSRSSSMLQQAQKGLWAAGAVQRVPAPQGPLPGHSFPLGQAPPPPSQGPSSSTVAALRAISSGAGAGGGARRGGVGMMDFCSEVDPRCGLPRRLPALGRS